jgi:hypothetical protein
VTAGPIIGAQFGTGQTVEQTIGGIHTPLRAITMPWAPAVDAGTPERDTVRQAVANVMDRIARDSMVFSPKVSAGHDDSAARSGRPSSGLECRT